MAPKRDKRLTAKLYRNTICSDSEGQSECRHAIHYEKFDG